MAKVAAAAIDNVVDDETLDIETKIIKSRGEDTYALGRGIYKILATSTVMDVLGADRTLGGMYQDERNKNTPQGKVASLFSATREVTFDNGHRTKTTGAKPFNHKDKLRPVYKVGTGLGGGSYGFYGGQEVLNALIAEAGGSIAVTETEFVEKSNLRDSLDRLARADNMVLDMQNGEGRINVDSPLAEIKLRFILGDPRVKLLSRTGEKYSNLMHKFIVIASVKEKYDDEIIAKEIDKTSRIASLLSELQTNRKKLHMVLDTLAMTDTQVRAEKDSSANITLLMKYSEFRNDYVRNMSITKGELLLEVASKSEAELEANHIATWALAKGDIIKRKGDGYFYQDEQMFTGSSMTQAQRIKLVTSKKDLMDNLRQDYITTGGWEGKSSRK